MEASVIDLRCILDERGTSRSWTVGIATLAKTGVGPGLIDRMVLELSRVANQELALLRIVPSVSSKYAPTPRRFPWWRTAAVSRAREATHDGYAIRSSIIAGDGTCQESATPQSPSTLPFLKRQFGLIVIDLSGVEPKMVESIGRMCNSVYLMVDPSRIGAASARKQVGNLQAAGVRLRGFWLL